VYRLSFFSKNLLPYIFRFRFACLKNAELRLFFNKIQNNLYQLTIFWTNVFKGPKTIFQVPTTVPQLKKTIEKNINGIKITPRDLLCNPIWAGLTKG
jgi:hypothetical protein